MAGHSKWANIQHRKGKQDAKRGKLFTKLIREITIAARLGGGDPNSNPRLRAALETARANSMGKDTIDRAIKRGAGGDDSANLEEVTYEGYGPGGVAVMVACTTDNRNRTVADVRHAFTKCGGNLGTDGSVAYLFSKVGLLNYPTGTNEDRLMELALEAGAEDIVTHEDGSIEVLTTPETFAAVRDRLVAGKFTPETAEITMRASTSTTLEQDSAESMIRLLEMLEDLDDVQKVYSNAEIPDDVLAALA
jgi:YebC/PmpR family DNA-binding regulatory protein